MRRPLVTIISPTFNQERYVASCAESALGQSYPHWEQIFVDDGSTDRTRDVLASFKDPRIRVLSLPHRGLESLEHTYNAALAASSGELVAILEGDDLWPLDKLELQVPSFDAPDTFLSWGRAELVDERGSSVGELVMSHESGARVRLEAREAFHRLTRANFLTPTVTVMVRRSALDRIGGFRQSGSSMLVDLPTWLWVTATQDGYAEFINRRLGLYRVHDAQTSQRKRTQMTREYIFIVRQVENELGSERLRRLGWTASARRRAEQRALLACGEAALEARRHREARADFLAVIRDGADARDLTLATIGLLSSILRVNLVRLALGAHAWLRRRRHARTIGISNG
jgi:glycosyltransferase involved in cell wall biosynthesis